MNHDGCDFQTPLDRRPTESDLVLGDERARARDSFANARSPSIANARRSSTNAMSRARSRRPFVFVRAPKRVRRRRRPRGTCRSRRRGRAIALFWDHFFSKFANFRNSADTKTRHMDVVVLVLDVVRGRSRRCERDTSSVRRRPLKRHGAVLAVHRFVGRRRRRRRDRRRTVRRPRDRWRGRAIDRFDWIFTQCGIFHHPALDDEMARRMRMMGMTTTRERNRRNEGESEWRVIDDVVTRGHGTEGGF